MASAAAVIAARRRIIAANATEISVHRVELVPSGGGRSKVESDLGPFTVRIYSTGKRPPAQPETVAGAQELDRYWGMMADETADLAAGQHVTDEFDADLLGHFRIQSVHAERVAGELVGYDAQLERIS